MFVIFFTIMASRYIKIRQRHAIDRLRTINIELSKTKKSLKNNAVLLWSKYIGINFEILSICRHIKSYSAYWSFFLTAIFPFYIILQCYLVHMILLVPKVPIRERSFFQFVLVDISVFFFMLISECARVVKLNQAMVTENRRFFLLYFNYGKAEGHLCAGRYQNVIKVIIKGLMKMVIQ